MPVVSVVLIFFNGERFIEEAVQSVRDQTLTDWELILVDDGSTDRSTEIARDVAAGDERIRYVDHPGHQNRGMSASRNLGVANASAPYIAFIDTDDVWVPTKLSEQVDLLAGMPDVALVCGAMLYWYSWNPAATEADHVVLTGGVADRRLDPPQAAVTLFPLGRRRGVGTDILVRRTVFDAVGGFEEQFRGMLEDQAFFIKVFMRYPIYISSRPWLRYRQHDASCIGQASRAERLRHRKIFLDWLQEDDARITDSRVSAAARRAHRGIRYRTLLGPAFVLFDRLPLQWQRRVKRVLRRDTTAPQSSSRVAVETQD
jgi:glycosyltransferase involved in cell wall biosynthesis